MSARLKEAQLLSIGALARAVGTPVETLRTWERRYGFPNAERTTTGHRRYSVSALERLRLVRAAIEQGHRPSVALVASEPELQLLLGQVRSAEIVATADEPAQALAHISSLDGLGLERELGASLSALGALRCLEDRVGPLVREIGERWVAGELGVCHEHFASERIQDFLARQWRPLSDAARGPIAVCATPASERHTLGLHMAAFTLALHGVRVVFLGGDLPAREIARAVAQHSARACVLSAARGADRMRVERECAELRTALGPAFPIVAGGEGFAAGLTSVAQLPSLSALDRWARTFASS
jgi:methylmalonyl-CoA mutase cobalamin-binding subunit